MRLLLIAAFAVSVGGCALFQKPDTTRAAAFAPAVAAPAGDRTARFRPAFDAGAPIALMPCRGQAALGDTCKRSTAVSHERRGDMPAGENSETFSDATTVSLTTE